MSRVLLSNIGWFTAYVVMLVIVVGALLQYRTKALAIYSTPEAESQWQDWRQAAEEIGKDGPVDRRAPKATQPLALLLMRDHFAACMGISLLLSSCLFGWMMICVRGVMKPVTLNEDVDVDFDS